MANWNSNDGFRNQRKRSFIYKSAGQNKPAGNAVKVDLNLTSSPSRTSHSSPRKKIKSSYSFYDKTLSDQEALDQLCSDLPADAFEDDLGDDFGDDLTAEQLCEAASVAEKLEEEMAVKKNNVKETRTNDLYLGDDYFDDLAVDNDVLEGATRKQVHNNVCHATATITSGNDETHFDTSAHETTALLFSSPGFSTNTVRNNDGMMQRNVAAGSRAHASNGCANGNAGSSEELQLLQSKLQELKEKVRKLEEDKFMTDGQLKTMNDTLAHYQAADAKQREKIRMIEEENKKTVEEKEKELKKQIEQLTTQLYFKDQEIAQAKEQVKKQMQVPINECSPHRKKNSKLADNSFIPTGQSFFEKKPIDVQSSPKAKVSRQKSPVKSKLEVAKPILEGPSSAGKVSLSSDSRGFENRAVKKDKKMDGSDNELLQKLLKLENIGVKSLSPEFEVCGVNQSIIKLLNSTAQVGPMEQSRREESAEIQKLVKQQTQTPKKGIELELNIEPKDNGMRQSVYNNIQELLNVHPSNFNHEHREELNLVSNCKAENFLDQKASSVQGFLPLLEYHISHYIDLRLENDEESLSSTSSPGSPGEGGEMRQPADKDGSLSLLEALDAAVQSLRCLNILVLHSDEVCELLLRSSKIFSSNENEVEELTETNNGIQQQSDNANEEKSDLLNLVFKLAVPLQNEPAVVTQVALSAISSMAQHCPTQYKNKFLTVLCKSLLPQCISRNSNPTNVISLLVPILMVSASIPEVMKHLCSQSDECLLLRVYHCCLSDAEDSSYQNVFQVILLIEKLLSSYTEAMPLLLDSECHCSLELSKYLVLLLHKQMVFLQHFPPDTLKLNKVTRCSFLLLRRGMFLLASLLTNSSRLLADLRVEVEQQYVNLIIGTTQLYGAIKDIPEGEGMLLQDLLDLEHIEDDEVQQDDDEEGVEDMEVDA